jgi:cytochrome P450
MVRESFKRTTPQERSAPALAYRLLLLNFAAVSTSTIAATNALLDIISAPSQNIISALRDEALNVLHENNGVWTKASVAKLHRLDSAIRESSRVSGVGGTGLARRVRAADGIILENGVWVPKGATVGVAQGGIHFDEKFYEKASEFDAFRFSRSKEELTSGGSRAKDETATERERETVTKKPWRNEDLVTTSPQFLAFSHGLHVWSVSSPKFHSTPPYTNLSLPILALVASSLPTN